MYIIFYHVQWIDPSIAVGSAISSQINPNPIAQVGNIGWSSGCHLHFEARTNVASFINGVVNPGDIDPTPYLSLVSSPAAATEQVTVAQRPERITEDLFLRSPTAPGLTNGVHQPTDANGTTFAWDDLGGILKGSPTGVWNADSSRLDVFGISSNDRVFHKAFSAGAWGQWTQIDSVGFLGISIYSQTEIVNVDRRPNGLIDLFIRGTSSDAQMGTINADGSGTPVWVSLGGYVKGAPSGKWNPNGTLLDVYAIGSDDHPYHKQLNTGYGWGGWQGPMTIATAAPAETEMITLVRRADGNMDLLAEGTNGHAFHYPVDSGGNIFAADDLGGGILGAPDGKWDKYATRLDVFAIGAGNQMYQITDLVPHWGPWRVVPGSRLWG